MSKLYATIGGGRQPKTCTGSNCIAAAAQSYDGSVITTLSYKDNNLKVKIETNDDSSCYGGWSNESFSGSFQELKDLLKLYNDIKSEKVSVVHHKANKEASE